MLLDNIVARRLPVWLCLGDRGEHVQGERAIHSENVSGNTPETP
jgi:hypothetical protein